MQTFSNMRRDSFNKKNIINILLFIFILFYSSLTDIFYWLPPLLGIAFVLFCRYMDTRKFYYIFLLMVYLLFFEAGAGFPFLSAVIFFCIAYFIFMPYLRFLVCSPKYLIPFYTLFIYYGYFLFCSIMGYITGMPVPNISLLFLVFSIIDAVILVFIL